MTLKNILLVLVSLFAGGSASWLVMNNNQTTTDQPVNSAMPVETAQTSSQTETRKTEASETESAQTNIAEIKTEAEPVTVSSSSVDNTQAAVISLESDSIVIAGADSANQQPEKPQASVVQEESTITDKPATDDPLMKVDLTNKEIPVEPEDSAELAQAQLDLEDARVEIATLKSDYSAVENEIATLKSDYSSVENEIATLKSNYSAVESKIATVLQMTGVKADINNLPSALDALTNKVDLLEVDLAESQVAHSAALATQELDTRALQKQHDLLLNERTQLKQKVDVFLAANQQHETSSNLASQEINRIQAILEDTDQQLVSSEHALASTRQQNQTLQGELDQIRSGMQRALSDKDVMISQLKDRSTKIRLGSDVVYGPGSTIVKEAGRKALDKIAGLIMKFPQYSISLEGHTDNIPISSESLSYIGSNWSLSAARAIAAAQYLEAKGVDSGKIRIVGFGPNHPVASNKLPEGRSENRRLEILFAPIQDIRQEEF